MKDGLVGPDVVNENMEDPVDAVVLDDAPNVIGGVVAADDAPNENTEEFGGCQEEPNMLVVEVDPLVELPDFPSEELMPKAGAEDPNRELLEENWKGTA